VNQTNHPADSFFLDPPWKILFGISGLLLVGVCILLRFSEFGSEEHISACRAALMLSGIAGAAGVWPIVTGWGKSGWRIVGGILAGGMIRLLIGILGLVIIFAFTEIHRTWLIFYVGIGYGLFLAADTAIGIWLLSRVVWNEDDASVHGTFWNCVGR
jgi:hypothetical protein